LLKAEREEDVTDALTIFGLEKFSDSNWLPYGGIENKLRNPTIMGLWLLEQVDKGGLEEPKRRAVSNSLGRLLLPMVDSLGSKLAELEQT
jgi:hypothetical protein